LISYWLDSVRYAQQCQFSATIARTKFKELEKAATSEYEAVMERFKKQVLEICQRDREIRSAEKRKLNDLFRQEKHLIFKDTFLTRPCGLCGSEEHQVLEQVEEENGEARFKYSCPSAHHEDYERIKRSPRKSVLSICPRKFARACSYNEEEMTNAISRLIRYRDGGMLSTELEMFETEARGQCKQNVMQSPEIERREGKDRGEEGTVSERSS